MLKGLRKSALITLYNYKLPGTPYIHLTHIVYPFTILLPEKTEFLSYTHTVIVQSKKPATLLLQHKARSGFAFAAVALRRARGLGSIKLSARNTIEYTCRARGEQAASGSRAFATVYVCAVSGFPLG